MASARLKKVVVDAPVKLNLGLDVLGMAQGGYHEVDMIMQAIGLYETVEVTRSMGYSLRCPGSRVPTDEKNTATKVAEAFFRETGLLAGADITLHKRCPTRAGMGGGSADAAGVLIGLNTLYGAQLTLPELQEIGRVAGADVPFSLLGGTARATGTGDVLESLPSLPSCWFAIAMPEQGVSTPAAYARYDELGSPAHPNIGMMAQALETNNLPVLAGEMQNALEYANGGSITPKIRQILHDAGALGSMMTGSGAAVFGLFLHEAEARQAAEKLKTVVPQVFVAPPVNTGPQVVQTVC